MYEAERRFVLAAYPGDCQPSRCDDLGGAGGFSGARFWRLATARGQLCLRRWPAEHSSREQLLTIHRALAHAASRGFTALPVPIATALGSTFVEHAGHLWELAPWLPGDADWAVNPSTARLSAAMVALAEFHRAVASVDVVGGAGIPAGLGWDRVARQAGMPAPPMSDSSRSSQLRPSPSVGRRLEQLTQWHTQGLEGLRRSTKRDSPWHRDVQHFTALFEPARRIVEPALRSAAEMPVASQVCIGDVWHDNLLFVGSEVTGIVDFGAMRCDSIATDVARLLASLAEDDQAAWANGLEAYESVRPLTPAERAVVPILDQGAVLLSGFNWLRWLVIEQRQFENADRVRQRLDLHLRRLNHLVAGSVKLD